jgi:ADP-ribose pyrophosphatase
MSRPLPAYPGLTIDSNETVWNGRFPIELVKFRHRRFDGGESAVRTWELWRRGQAAALLPYDPVADAVVLIEQFRLPALAAGVDPVMIEVPAGLCDAGETAEVTIRREIQEEAGLIADRLERIGDFVLTPGGADEKVTLFAGRVRAPAAGVDGIVGYAGLAGEQEDIRVRVWPASEAIARAVAGKLPNVVTSLALLWLAAKRDDLQRLWSAT